MRASRKLLLCRTVSIEARAYRRILGRDYQIRWFAWLVSVGVVDVVAVMPGCFIVVVLAGCPLKGINGAECGEDVYGGERDPHEGVEGEGSVGVEGVERG